MARKLKADVTETTIRLNKKDYALFQIHYGRLRKNALVPLAEATDLVKEQVRKSLFDWARSQAHA